MDFISNFPNIIFLCGFMGTGKSTIGQRLASELKVTFRDLDKIIEDEAGRSIKEIFAENGEPAFRKLERNCLLKQIEHYRGVLSMGGGALQNQYLVDHVKLNGLLIFIETPFSVILKRIQQNKERPLLLDEKGSIKREGVLEKELTELYEERLSYYRQAEITIRTENYSSIHDTVEALIKKIRNHVELY